MNNHNTLTTSKLQFITLSSITLFAAVLLLIPNIESQIASAQSAGSTDTFQAKGYMGNLVLAPETLQSLNQSQDTNLNFINGGNWSFDVSNGKLQNFNVELTRHSLGGHEAETHIIDGLDNATALSATDGDNRIVLTGNNTQFKGLADIQTVESGKIWNDVPLTVFLINGHILNLGFDVAKTEGHFVNLPLFGVVTSLTEQSGQNNSTSN
jgi:hypothetical protein